MKPTIFIATILALGVSLNSHAQKVPGTWTHAMKLEASYHGGMSQYSFTLVITDTLSSMTETTQKGRKVYKQKFTQKELDSLLAFLKAHRFDQIRNNEQPTFTHDKASESIGLSWDSTYIGASESASSKLLDEYQEDFNAIQDYVKTLFRKQ